MIEHNKMIHHIRPPSEIRNVIISMILLIENAKQKFIATPTDPFIKMAGNISEQYGSVCSNCRFLINLNQL